MVKLPGKLYTVIIIDRKMIPRETLNHYPKNIGNFIRGKDLKSLPKNSPKILFTYLHPIFTEGITGEGIKADT